jgi:methyl-accepting chemotaxis protein I, serine sensor receptor
VLVRFCIDSEIVEAIFRVSSIMGEIAAAAIEQSTGID